VNTWDFEAKKERAVLFGTVEGSVVSIAISPDGTKALRSLEGGTIEVWDLGSAKQIRRFEHRKPRAVWRTARTGRSRPAARTTLRYDCDNR
jgi:WD40 repeat protein